MTTKRAAVIGAWIVAIVIAALLDRPVALFMRDQAVDWWLRSHDAVRETLKFPGTYYCTAIVAIIVVLTHELRFQGGGFVLLATVVSGINGLIKWIAGRTRPFKLPVEGATGRLPALPFNLSPFRGGLPGLFKSTNLCFPSGHATLAFATAAAVAILWPKSRWRWLGYVVAAIVAAERVAENAHWLSDTVAGAAIGIAGVHLMHWIVRTIVERNSRPVGSRLTADDD